MSLSREEIYDKVRAVIVEALGVEPELVVPDAVLRNDLDAESIDFLHVVFELEHVFGIEIPREELFPEDVMNNPELRRQGVVPPQLLADLRTRMPFAELAALERDPRVENLSTLFTVEAVVRFVELKLAGR